MACERFTDSLGALIDGTIGRDEKRALDEHLQTCAACRTLAADLRRIHDEAAQLPRVEPPAELWVKVRERVEKQAQTTDAARVFPGLSGVEGRPSWIRSLLAALKTRPTYGDRPTSFWNTRPAYAYALASALVIVLAVGTGYVLLRQRAGQPATQPAGQTAEPQMSAAGGNASDQEFVQSVEMELRLAEQHYEKAIAGLEQIAKADQGSLDPQVAAVLQKNLGIIDQAIRESRVALQSQPTNQVAQATLFEAFRRKVALLQDTITLINEMRKGDQAGAARVLQNLNKG